MEWIDSILFEHSAVQAVIVIAIIIAVGLAFGKLRLFGISLGVTCVFFAGIFAGHIGLTIDPAMLHYAESFGLVLFVYELGLKVGPGFFSSFRKGGIEMNMLGIGVILIGTVLALLFSPLFGIGIDDMVGVLCGATTNTPALGAAQQALQQIGHSANGAALSCAVTYPLGVVGVILAMMLVRKLFIKPSQLESHDDYDGSSTYIAEFQVANPAIYGHSVREIASLSAVNFIISRLWRNGKVTIPGPETVLEADDRILVVTVEKDVPRLTVVFGEQESRDWNKDDIDWNAIDSQLISKHIVVSRPEINGKRLGSLRLRNSYGINISRVMRSGVQLLATPRLVLQLGDRLTVVGEAKAIENVEKVLGNTVVSLKDPNLAAIFVGIVLGLILGSIPLTIPGMSFPVKLGLAGGPIIVGILMGRFGPRFHLVTYTTRSANLMLRGMGLSLYLACLGLEAGGSFVDTLLHSGGMLWIGVGFLLTVIPVIIMLLVAVYGLGIDYGSACGMACGAMANPMALNYVNDTVPNDNGAVSYATVYPLSMFIRVIVAQIIVLVFA